MNMHNLDSRAITSLYPGQSWRSHQMNDCPYLGGICSSRKLNQEAVDLKALRAAFWAAENGFLCQQQSSICPVSSRLLTDFPLKPPIHRRKHRPVYSHTPGMVFLLLLSQWQQLTTHTCLPSPTTELEQWLAISFQLRIPSAFTNTCTNSPEYLTLILIGLPFLLTHLWSLQATHGTTSSRRHRYRWLLD